MIRYSREDTSTSATQIGPPSHSKNTAWLSRGRGESDDGIEKNGRSRLRIKGAKVKMGSKTKMTSKFAGYSRDISQLLLDRQAIDVLAEPTGYLFSTTISAGQGANVRSKSKLL